MSFIRISRAGVGDDTGTVSTMNVKLTDSPRFAVIAVRLAGNGDINASAVENIQYTCILHCGVTHVVIVACNYPLSAYMNCNSSLW